MSFVNPINFICLLQFSVFLARISVYISSYQLIFNYIGHFQSEIGYLRNFGFSFQEFGESFKKSAYLRIYRRSRCGNRRSAKYQLFSLAYRRNSGYIGLSPNISAVRIFFIPSFMLNPLGLCQSNKFSDCVG